MVSFPALSGVVGAPNRRDVAFGVPLHGGCPTGNWEQGNSCATTATPGNRVRR